MLVGSDKKSFPQGQPAPATVPAQFVPDGFIHPRPTDVLFDCVVRAAAIPAATTLDVLALTQEERVKTGYIRKVGYSFNSPHAYFQVRTFILVQGGTVSQYLFKTVDSGSATALYQGSFPVMQTGSILQPTEVFIYLPANTPVSIRFVNNSIDETFSGVVRLWGWSQGG